MIDIEFENFYNTNILNTSKEEAYLIWSKAKDSTWIDITLAPKDGTRIEAVVTRMNGEIEKEPVICWWGFDDNDSNMQPEVYNEQELNELDEQELLEYHDAIDSYTPTEEENEYGREWLSGEGDSWSYGYYYTPQNPILWRPTSKIPSHLKTAEE